jgi:hypothetical protein
MRQISAVLVMTSGLATLLASSVWIRHGDTQLFVSFVGLVVAAVGLGVWMMLVRNNFHETTAADSRKSFSRTETSS